MASGIQSSEKASFTTEQDEILMKLQAEGLNGTGKKHKALLDRAVRETGLPMNVICNKVHNMRRGSRTPEETAAPARKHMQVRKKSAYNLFCHLTGSKSNDKTLRQKMWSRMWATLTKKEKQWYYEEAAKLNNTPLSELQGEKKEAAVKTSRDAIMYHMKRLQKLQPFHGLVILTDNETVWSSACGSGNEVLAQQELQLQAALSKGFENSIPRPSTKRQRDSLRKAVQTKIRDVYGNFCKVEGGSRFPYQQYIDGKCDFAIVGLPQGFVFKKPCDMGIKNLKVVLDSDLSIITRAEPGINADTSNNDASHTEGPDLPLVTEGSDLHEAMDIVPPSSIEEQSPSDDETMETITYEISLEEGSFNVESTTLSHQSQAMVEDNITSLPHQSAEDAIRSVQEMADALMKRNSNGIEYERDDKGKIVLQSILGKTMFQLWVVTDDNNVKSKMWYKGTVVETKRGKYAIDFNEDDGPRTLTPTKATTGLSKGTMLLLD